MTSCPETQTGDGGLRDARMGARKKLLGLSSGFFVSDNVACDLGTGRLPREQQGVACGREEAKVGRRVDG